MVVSSPPLCFPGTGSNHWLCTEAPGASSLLDPASGAVLDSPEGFTVTLYDSSGQGF